MKSWCFESLGLRPSFPKRPIEAGLENTVDVSPWQLHETASLHLPGESSRAKLAARTYLCIYGKYVTSSLPHLWCLYMFLLKMFGVFVIISVPIFQELCHTLSKMSEGGITSGGGGFITTSKSR